MTALALDRKVPQADINRFPLRLSFGAEANTILYSGGMAATNAAGNCVPASAIGSLKIHGIIDKQVNNLTTNVPYGAAGAQFVAVIPGCFPMNISTDGGAINATTLKQYVFAVDDNTVSLSDLGGARPLAGYVAFIDASGLVYIQLGEASPYALNPEIIPSTSAFRARNVGSVGANVALLTAYTTNSGNDGVTNVAGDVVVLASQTAPAQNGPYVVGTVVANAAPLARPDWWTTGSVYKTGTQIRFGGEGAVFKNTVWQAMLAADTFTVDTSDPKLYPLQVSGQTALAAGTMTISVPVFSVKSEVGLTRVALNGGNPATTVMYVPTVAAGTTGITPGVQGTGAVIVTAQVAAGNALVAGDTALLNWTVTNQP